MELFLPHGPLGRRVDAIASKSQLQRLLLCAALADRETVVHGASDAADVQAMCRCLRALGAQITSDGRALRVQPVTEQAHGAADCGESGATLRFLLPWRRRSGSIQRFICTAACRSGRSARCGKRWRHGVRLSRPRRASFSARAGWKAATFCCRGMFRPSFSPACCSPCRCFPAPQSCARPPPESAGYIAMTLAALRRFGIAAEPLPDGWAVPAGNVTAPRRGPGGGRLVERGLLACGGRARGR